MAPTTAKVAGSAARLRLGAMHAELRERICLLRYPPGMRLAEARLALELGVSRTPIRAVLGRLEQEGLVEIRHGVGTFVTVIDRDELAEVYALRMRLAELIGDLDPLPRGRADIERLRRLLARLERLRAAPEPTEFARINMAFQQEISRAIGNRALREVGEGLYFRTARFFVQSVPRLDLAREIEIFATEIRDISSAMQRGDMRAVGFIRRNHIALSCHRMTLGLGRADPPPPALHEAHG
jgi:DNA-binding GntR family transcriptional regulator